MFARHAILDAEAAALLVLVVGADPVAREEALRELEAAVHARADVAAEVPHVLDAVEGVQEEGQRESGVRHEVGAGVGEDVGVGDAVGGVEDAHGFWARGAVGGEGGYGGGDGVGGCCGEERAGSRGLRRGEFGCAPGGFGGCGWELLEKRGAL